MTTETTPDVVYENTIDGGTWHMMVTRIKPYQGQLVVTHVETGRTILDRPVPMSYDAIFGPDHADLENWQLLTLGAIDSQDQA